MGRPPKFSTMQLQQAALELVDKHGLAGLSMRSLASALGTGAMTLYNHVPDRDGLDLLVIDAVLAQVRWPTTCHNDWRDQVEAIAVAGWQAVRAHPHVLQALASSGLSGHALLIAFRAVSAFVMGFAQAELAGPLATEAGEHAQDVIARMRMLAKDQYPRLTEMAKVANLKKVDLEFRAGLRALLIGLALSKS
jgi:AcrR family transcriptional regulator